MEFIRQDSGLALLSCNKNENDYDVSVPSDDAKAESQEDRPRRFQV